MNRTQSLRHSLRYRMRSARFAVALSALVLVLLLTHTMLASEELTGEETPPGSRTLYPGNNLIGWVGFPTSAQELFDQIPQVVLVYAWDAQLSEYRFAARELRGSLHTLEPGMGLIVRISGEVPVEWQQPTVANGDWVSLKPGPNLVAWTGPSGTPIDLAMRSIGESFTHALYSDTESEGLGRFQPGAKSSATHLHRLQRGDGIWVFNSEETRWLQPSGERALYPLGPPPDQVRWYASFDKYLDADGIAVISTENVADEALFRAAAIFDDLLINRPDIRETLIRRRVHIVVVGQSEKTFDLAPYRQYRDRIELEPWGESGPRGLGPNQFTPTLVPEENLLCHEGDRYGGYDVAVHEFAHAIDYALSHGASRGNFSSSLARAYRSGMDSGLWEGTYASRNTAEFWAQGVQAWLGLGSSYASPFKNRLHLSRYAPPTAELIVSTLGDFQVDSSCHPARAAAHSAARMYAVQGRLTDHLGEPPPQARILLDGMTEGWSQTAYRSETSVWPDGGFGLFVAPRHYLMRLIIDGCHVFYSSSGPTPASSSAKLFSVTDQDLEFDIQLKEPVCTIAASGVLLDASGKSDITYSLTASGDTGKSQTVGGEGGTFKIRFPNEGRYSLRFDYQGCEYFYDGAGLVRGPRWDLQFDARQLADTELNLRLPSGACSGTIAGTVLDEEGMPAQGILVGLHIPAGQSALRVGASGSFTVAVDLPSEPILEVSAQGCRAYFGSNGLQLNVDEVTPFDLTNAGINDLEIVIPDTLCDTELMGES